MAREDFSKQLIDYTSRLDCSFMGFIKYFYVVDVAFS